MTATAVPRSSVAGPSVVEVTRVAGRLRSRLRSGLLRPQLLHGPADRCRVGLLATTALLLGGDAVELEVHVGAGVTLELADVAGTVAYDGRGRPARWDVSVRVAAGGRLWWSGEPFVVADGAEVSRRLDLELSEGGGVLMREIVVLGRAGQLGGALRNRSSVRLGGRPVLVEDQVLDPRGQRLLPGMLGPLRVVDTVLAVGLPWSAPADVVLDGWTTTSRLPEGGGRLTRHLGHELATSPLHAPWALSRPVAPAAAD